MTADKLRSHRTYMRSKGKTEGHELKVGESIAGSLKGSQVDPNEKKEMNDFDGIDLTTENFIKLQ